MENPLNWKNSIVLVPFPFDDLAATKVRPALCLTERLGSHDHVVVAFITSEVPGELDPTDIVILPRRGFRADGPTGRVSHSPPPTDDFEFANHASKIRYFTRDAAAKDSRGTAAVV
jgi:hypothetical protein